MYLKLPSGESNVSAALVSAVEESATKSDQTLTVGLDEIPALDAATMNGLITALRRMRDGGGTVQLHVTRHDVLATLDETGLDKVFKVVASPDEPRQKPVRKRKRRRGGIRKIAGGLAGAVVALLVLGAR
jgi:anti-anti-sigma regulatory factor